MALPTQKFEDKNLMLLQATWKTQLDPVLANPLVQGQIIRSVPLQTGSNTINHGLGRKLQGWVIIRQRASGTVYDTQDTNTMPALTLLLTASGAINVDLYVF